MSIFGSDPASSERRLGVFIALGVAALPALLAFGLGLMTDIGREVERDFPVVVAQVAPVLFLAAAVEARAAVAVFLSRWDDAADVELMMGIIRSLAALFVAAEATSLYSVASGTRTTFLVFTPCIAMLMMVLWMIAAMRDVMTER